ncbi:MAG: FecR family protein [Elusimicrobiota bacterium]|jgi:hypothetical protein
MNKILWMAFFFLLSPVVYAAGLAENQSRFGKVTGDVGLLSPGAADWIEAHEGLPLEPGDHIRTGEDGEVEIILSENVIGMLRPQTDLTLGHLETNSGQVSLSRGVFLGRVDSTRAAPGQNWGFNTPMAVCAVRGTEFALEMSKEDGTHLGVFNGEVEMSPAEGAGGLPEPVRVAAGHEGIAQRGKPLKVLDRFTPRMQGHRGLLHDLSRRQLRVQQTWSPFTPEYHKDLRRRFVAPVRKRPAHRAAGLHRDRSRRKGN